MIKNNDILKSFWACQIDINKTMIFESANQTMREKAFMHGLVNTCMPIIYTPGTYASFFLPTDSIYWKYHFAWCKECFTIAKTKCLPSGLDCCNADLWRIFYLLFSLCSEQIPSISYCHLDNQELRTEYVVSRIKYLSWQFIQQRKNYNAGRRSIFRSPRPKHERMRGY